MARVPKPGSAAVTGKTISTGASGPFFADHNVGDVGCRWQGKAESREENEKKGP